MGVEVPERLRPWLTFGAFALVANCVVPVCLVFSPGISFLVQGLEGVWLACACWVLATATDEDAEYMYWLLCNATRWRKSSRNGGVQVSPQRQGTPLKNAARMHHGPLEFLVSLPAIPPVWIDLQLRALGLPRYLRFAILNFATFLTAPIWFFVTASLYLVLLLAVSAVSFGVLLFWTGPLMITCLAYLVFVPVWIFSTYVCASGPMIVCTWLMPLVDNRATMCSRVLLLGGISVPHRDPKSALIK